MKVKEKISASKRPKIELNYDLKKQICKTYLENLKLNKHYTHAMLIDHFEPIVGARIARSTLSDILKLKEKIEVSNNVQYRARPAKYPELEDCLFIKMNDMLDRLVNVTDDILLAKAKEIGN